MRAPLSVFIITFNEEACIERCLRSVSFADEIVVVDSNSTDRTRDISRELGAKVILTKDWPGFGAQKNRALAAATGDWVFSLDADEWVEPPRSKPPSTIHATASVSKFRGGRASAAGSSGMGVGRRIWS